MVSRFGRSSLGLAYSIVLTDAVIAPAVPEQHCARRRALPDRAVGGAGLGLPARRSRGRRLGGYLMFCGDGEPGGVVGAVDDGDVGQPDRHAGRAASSASRSASAHGSLAASVPALTAILRCRCVVAWLYPPGVGETPEAPAAARKALAELGPLSRDERITAVAFVLMVSGWIFADALGLNVTSIAFAGLGVLLVTSVLTLDDIATQGDTLATFLWLAVLFALSGQLNELGFMGYVGQRLAVAPGRVCRGR